MTELRRSSSLEVGWKRGLNLVLGMERSLEAINKLCF